MALSPNAARTRLPPKGTQTRRHLPDHGISATHKRNRCDSNCARQNTIDATSQVALHPITLEYPLQKLYEPEAGLGRVIANESSNAIPSADGAQISFPVWAYHFSWGTARDVGAG